MAPTDRLGTNQRNKVLVGLCVVTWLTVVAAGGSVLLTYQNSPGTPAAPPGSWPAGTPFQRAPGTATLVMFAHPRCPCTRASIAELARLAARLPGRFEAHVLFHAPSENDEAWVQSGLWTAAAAIPGVTARRDPDGQVAAGFGALTSGQTVLYDSAGNLLFRGGITASRGHVGDNVGRTKIIRLLEQHDVQDPTTPVFGCPLVGPEACEGDPSGCKISKRSSLS